MIKENIYEKITLNKLKAQAKTVKTMISIFWNTFSFGICDSIFKFPTRLLSIINIIYSSSLISYIFWNAQKPK